jgi:TonB family protein
LAALIYLGVEKLGPGRPYVVSLIEVEKRGGAAPVAKINQGMKPPAAAKVSSKTPATTTSSSSAASSSLKSTVEQGLQAASAAINYPLAARLAQEEGTVNLAIEILPRGLVGQIKVLAGTTASPTLIQAAVEGLAKMQMAAWPLDKARWFSHQVIFKLQGGPE